MAFLKTERDDCQVYFVNDNPQLSSRWGIKLTKKERDEWKKAEHDFWFWQTWVEDRLNEDEKKNDGR